MSLSEQELRGLLAEQIEYYRARAHEYDDWWNQTGRHNKGTEATSRFAQEVAELYDALALFDPQGDVLELACGTGIWSERLARTATSLTCLDAAAEVIQVNRARLTSASLPEPLYINADVFTWKPNIRYDVIFFGFWLSHVPAIRFVEFWDMVRSALKPDGRVFFIDEVASDAVYTPTDAEDRQLRELSDGRTFTIVKRYYDPKELSERLAALGWQVEVRRTSTHFLHGAVW